MSQNPGQRADVDMLLEYERLVEQLNMMYFSVTMDASGDVFAFMLYNRADRKIMHIIISHND